MVTRHPVTNDRRFNFEMDSRAPRSSRAHPGYSPKGNKYFQLAIVLDGVLYFRSAHTRAPSKGTADPGNFDLKEAFELQNVLENPLEAPIKILDQRTSIPSLGAAPSEAASSPPSIGTMPRSIMYRPYMWADACAMMADLMPLLMESAPEGGIDCAV